MTTGSEATGIAGDDVSGRTINAAGEAQVRQRVDALVERIEAKDLDGLGRLYASDVVSFDVEPPLQHLGREAKLRSWTSVFTFFRDVCYELRDLAFTVDDNVAFAHGFGRLSGTLATGAETGGMWVRATLCFRRVDGEWLITHDQVSVPFDVRSGRGVADLAP
ncbi:YybH family protein [Promicromonospora sp. NPDC060271]|uniref:YybH family protein n=1 Tax=Promicromonospora sp. NPDC060271 TaxID=3347089 RepID=UPI00364D8EAE